jgi:hypothetical protein
MFAVVPYHWGFPKRGLIVAESTGTISIHMCRNIKTLYNFATPATEKEIRASALQFVRKLSGFNTPSKANEAAFERAVDRVSELAHELIHSLVTNAPPRTREAEQAKTRARAAKRFAIAGTVSSSI